MWCVGQGGAPAKVLLLLRSAAKRTALRADRCCPSGRRVRFCVSCRQRALLQTATKTARAALTSRRGGAVKSALRYTEEQASSGDRSQARQHTMRQSREEARGVVGGALFAR